MIGSVQLSLPRALLTALALLVLSEIIVVAPTPAVVVVVLAAAWSAWPGIVLVRRVLGADAAHMAWLVGPGLGVGFSVFGAFLLWAMGVRNWLVIAAGPGLTWLVAWFAGRIRRPALRLPRLDRRDLTAVALALFIVPAVTWLPYDHVREPVEDGEAYRAYFTADFLWAVTVTSELAKGQVPPANPFLTDEPLHYYWLAHFLSGAVYRNVREWDVTAEQVVLINGLAFDLAAVAFLYGLIRAVGAGPAASVLAVAAGFLANSYEGLDMIRAILTHGQPWRDLKDTNIDAVTRWFYKGMAVDGLQRMLLYQPHHLPGYMLALAAVWLVGLAEDVSEAAVGLAAGILLGLSVLFSTFTAIILGCAAALLYAVRLRQQRRWRWTVHCAVLGAAPVILAIAFSEALGYADRRHGPLLTVGLNPAAFAHLPRVLVLSFGPLLFAGLAALVRVRWVAGQGSAPVAVALAALAFYFLTNVPDTGDVWVGWRSGHLLLVAFAAMGAAAVESAWRACRARALLSAVIAAGLALALPTVAIDVYNAQDVDNREPGPAFPWTLVVTPAEREALEWIRRRTPARAVVQVEPYIRGAKHWAYIQAFAERRAAAGLPIAMIPIKPYRDRSDDVYWGIFRALTADDAYKMAKYLKIDYLALGVPERRAYATAIGHIASSPDLFRPVFRNDEMTIFHVE
jgi:hypothetical protein